MPNKRKKHGNAKYQEKRRTVARVLSDANIVFRVLKLGI